MGLIQIKRQKSPNQQINADPQARLLFAVNLFCVYLQLPNTSLLGAGY